MTVDELIGQMAENRAWIAGARVAIDFGDDGAVLLDGKAKKVVLKNDYVRQFIDVYHV